GGGEGIVRWIDCLGDGMRASSRKRGRRSHGRDAGEQIRVSEQRLALTPERLRPEEARLKRPVGEIRHRWGEHPTAQTRQRRQIAGHASNLLLRSEKKERSVRDRERNGQCQCPCGSESLPHPGPP